MSDAPFRFSSRREQRLLLYPHVGVVGNGGHREVLDVLPVREYGGELAQPYLERLLVQQGLQLVNYRQPQNLRVTARKTNIVAELRGFASHHLRVGTKDTVLCMFCQYHGTFKSIVRLHSQGLIVPAMPGK